MGEYQAQIEMAELACKQGRGVLLAGCPGSGKTTFAMERIKYGDMILDLDLVLLSISGVDIHHDKPANLLQVGIGMYEAALRKVDERIRFLWLIAGAPEARKREDYCEKHNLKCIVFETSPAECMKRIRDDTQRPTGCRAWRLIIDDWWKRYQHRRGDIIIRRSAT